MISRDPNVANIDSRYATKSFVSQGLAACTPLNQSIQSFNTSNITITSTHNNRLLLANASSGAATVTVNTSAGIPVGGRVDIIWTGAATSVTVVASSVTINATPGLKLRDRYSAATLICVGTNSYILVGDLNA